MNVCKLESHLFFSALPPFLRRKHTTLSCEQIKIPSSKPSALTRTRRRRIVPTEIPCGQKSLQKYAIEKINSNTSCDCFELKVRLWGVSCTKDKWFYTGNDICDLLHWNILFVISIVSMNYSHLTRVITVHIVCINALTLSESECHFKKINFKCFFSDYQQKILTQKVHWDSSFLMILLTVNQHLFG